MRDPIIESLVDNTSSSSTCTYGFINEFMENINSHVKETEFQNNLKDMGGARLYSGTTIVHAMYCKACNTIYTTKANLLHKTHTKTLLGKCENCARTSSFGFIYENGGEPNEFNIEACANGKDSEIESPFNIEIVEI